MCPLAFSQELEYWGINESALDGCCLDKFNLRKDRALKDMMLPCDPELYAGDNEVQDEGASCKQRLWKLMEDPHSSTAAKVRYEPLISN